MKKCLLFLFSLVLAGSVFAGNRDIKVKAKVDAGIEQSGQQQSFAKVSGTKEVGQMTNGYAIIAGYTNMIAYDPISNTAVVVKRRGPAGTDGTVRAGSGTIAFHVSGDKGETWSAAQEMNGFTATAAGRYPSVAVLNDGGTPYLTGVWGNIPAWGPLGAASYVAEAVESQKPTAVASFFEPYRVLAPGDTSGYGIPNELFADEKNGDLYFAANMMKVTNGAGTATFKSYSSVIYRSSNGGASWDIFHKVLAFPDDASEYFDAVSAHHGDFNSEGEGWTVVAVSLDSAWAVANNLNYLSYYPHLTQIKDGAVVAEGLIDIYNIAGIKSTNVDSWPGEADQASDYDIVTDKDGNFHLFLALEEADVEGSSKLFEIYSMTPDGENLGANVVADLRTTYQDLTSDGTDAYNNIEAATDKDGKYVFTKWLDTDEFDETTTEIYWTGRAITSSAFEAPVAVNENDAEMQFQSKFASVVADADAVTDGKAAFQGNVLWAAMPKNSGGTYDAQLTTILNYSGPVIELDKYSGAAEAKLTFVVNTAFVQDTITSAASVSIRGAAFGGDWSLDKGIKFNHLDGDYWIAEKTVPVGKSGGGFKVVTATPSGTGWDRHMIGEFDVTGDDILGYYTTGLKEVYTDPFTGASVTRGDDWDPLEIAKNGNNDVYAVHFRVNMIDQLKKTFNPKSHTVTVRGGFNGWGANDTLKAESRHDDLGGDGYPGETFYSKTILIPKSSAGNMEYKFVYSDAASTTWEDHIIGGGNRKFTLSNDTTLYWKYFDDERVVVEPPSGKFKVAFEVDLEKAINTNGFDKSTDTLIARIGFLGGGGTVDAKLEAPFAGTVYTGETGNDSLAANPGAVVMYQYYKKNAAGEFEEFYFDNNNELPQTSAPKFRKVTMPESGSFVATADLLADNVSTHRQPFFKNTNKIGVATTLTLEVNLLPAHLATEVFGFELKHTQGGALIVTKDNIRSLDLYINGPATGSWGDWTDTGLGVDRKLTNKGNGIWTFTKEYPADAIISQEFKMGIGGGDNEAGFGNNHMVNLFPQATNTSKAQFGDIQPSRYAKDASNYWSFADESAVIGGVKTDIFTLIVKAGDDVKANKFALLQNYPNPFNPSTSLPFTVASAGLVNFTVYNIMGQEVRSFSYNATASGYHEVPFNAENLASGTYLVKMTAGSSTNTIKMVFMK